MNLECLNFLMTSVCPHCVALGCRLRSRCWHSLKCVFRSWLVNWGTAAWSWESWTTTCRITRNCCRSGGRQLKRIKIEASICCSIWFICQATWYLTFFGGSISLICFIYIIILQENDVLRKQNVQLSEENGKLVGHKNHKQRIEYLVKLKRENTKLQEVSHKF